MKKILFFIMTIALSLTLFACGKDDKTTKLVKDGDWVTPAHTLAAALGGFCPIAAYIIVAVVTCWWIFPEKAKNN